MTRIKWIYGDIEIETVQGISEALVITVQDYILPKETNVFLSREEVLELLSALEEWLLDGTLEESYEKSKGE